MHNIFILIVIDFILEHYNSEKEFCEKYLKIDFKKWNMWKNSFIVLNNKILEKINNLFTDYEHMILKKVIKKILMLPERRNFAVYEYKRLKTIIAKKWLKSGIGNIKLIVYKKNNIFKKKKYSNYFDLIVKVSYNEWGFDDIIKFRIYSNVLPKIEFSKLELLNWVNVNLMSIYLKK